MEEDAYRSTYHQINTTRCAFEKTILNRQGNCPQSHKFCLAEREGVTCKSSAHQKRCQQFLAMMRSKAQFVLKLTQPGVQLPHAKELKVQLGGLQGLAELVDYPRESKNISDINGLVAKIESRYSSLDEVPVEGMLNAIRNMPGRRQRKKHHPEA